MPRPFGFALTRRTALVGTLQAFGLLALFARPAAAFRARPGMRKCPENECGHWYDPEEGDPEAGIPPGVAFKDLPDDWECPECGTPKKYW